MALDEWQVFLSILLRVFFLFIFASFFFFHYTCIASEGVWVNDFARPGVYPYTHLLMQGLSYFCDLISRRLPGEID